jgi:hypothetical protein
MAITVADAGLKTQRTNASTAIFGPGNRRDVVPTSTDPTHQESAPGLRAPKMANFDPIRPVVAIDEIYNQVWTNDPVLTSELLSHTPSAAAGITEVSCGGCSLYHRSTPVVLWSLTHSGHCADKLANTTTSAQELRDTDSDMIDELDRDKLSEVGQVNFCTFEAWFSNSLKKKLLLNFSMCGPFCVSSMGCANAHRNDGCFDCLRAALRGHGARLHHHGPLLSDGVCRRCHRAQLCYFTSPSCTQ